MKLETRHERRRDPDAAPGMEGLAYGAVRPDAA